MSDLRNTLLDLTNLKNRLKTEKCANLISDCRKFPDDPVMQLMASFWMMSDVVLDEKPEQLHHQLFGRLGLYQDLYPEIAGLLEEVRKDNTGLHLLKPTLQPAYRGLHRILRGHTEQVVGALVLRDERILTWAWDKTLRLWSSDGEPLAVMIGHTDYLKKAIQLSTGRILSWSNNLHEQDTTLRLWSSDGEPLAVMIGHENSIFYDVLELSNGNLLTRGRNEDFYLLWNPDGQLIKKLDPATQNSELPNGNLLTRGRNEDFYLLWNPDGQLIKKLDPATQNIDALIVKSDKLFGINDSTLKIYTLDGDFIEEILRSSIIGGFPWIRGTLTDGRMFGWRETTLYFYKDYKTVRHHVEVFDKDCDLAITSAQELMDGRILVYCKDVRPEKLELHLFSNRGEHIAKVKDYTRSIQKIIQLEDEKLLLHFSDSKLELWSPDLEYISSLEGHDGWMRDVVELDDGRILTFSGDETIRLWTSDGKALGVIGGQSAGVLSAGISNGHPVSYANSEFSRDKTVSIWNYRPDEIKLPPHHYGYPYTIIELRDERILSCSTDSSLMMWSKEGDLIRRMRTKDSWSVYGATELHDGKIVSWSPRHSVLWNKDGDLIDTYDPDTFSIYGAIELQGGRILTFDRYGKRLLIRTADMIDLYILEGHMQYIGGAIALRDERILSWDGHYREEIPAALHLWSSEDGEPLAVMEGHQSAINGAIELHNGRILSWSNDKTLRLWSPTGEPLAIMSGHSKAIFDVFELADGRILSSDLIWNQHETLLWSSDGQFIENVETDRGLLISQNRDEIYWDRKDNTVKGYKQGKLIHEFVADTTVYAICGTQDGGVALGDYRGNIHILKP